ncbi:MAG: DUF4860 domain-containing protein [Lachnospiraceae bacterium]|nr:DUF4860 domain-containing protein [Lachnospiraceae bacterium]
MNSIKREKSIIDIIFVFIVFGILLLCSLFVVLYGAKIYKKTAHDMYINFNSRTALAYVTEKMHQYDKRGCVEVTIEGDNPVLILKQFVNNDEYYTYLYSDEGFLKELTVKSDIGLIKNAGTKILKLKDFSAKKISDSLYKFIIVDEENNKNEFYVSIYSYTSDIADN